MSFLARFCRKKLSGCPQCQDRQAILLHYAFQASSCQSICLQRMLSSTSVFSYMMPSKPLAAKASVFKLPKQLSSTATSYMMSHRQSLRNQTSPKTDFTVIFLAGPRLPWPTWTPRRSRRRRAGALAEVGLDRGLPGHTNQLVS